MSSVPILHKPDAHHPKSDMLSVVFKDEVKNEEVTVTLPDLRLFINGRFQCAQKGQKIPVTDPSTGNVITHVDAADEIDVHLAVEAARNALVVWSNEMSSADRSAKLFELANLLEECKVEFAVLNSLEQGKPFQHSLNIEVSYAIKCIRFAAEMADIDSWRQHHS